MTPDKVITGDFSSAQEGAFVFLPFDVPAGQTAVRVKYCYDQPDLPTNARVRHTLDIGLYQPRTGGDTIWDAPEFRGWSGSNISDFKVTPEGYSPSSGFGTTRGYLPGPIPSGEWAVELGLASVVGQSGGDLDGGVNWRVEIDYSNDAANSNEPYQSAAYDSSPAKPGSAWYAGDFHVHSSMSGDAGSATLRKVLSYAFCPDPALGNLCAAPEAQPGAGLDFTNVNDHNNGAAWGEIGRYQADYPGHLVIRSQEVTTYRGHTQSDANPHYVDYRTGPVYQRESNGSLTLLREPTAPGMNGGIFDQVHAGGGFTQINHPTIFPSLVPSFSELCRGCPWDYSDAETDYSKVDAIEVSTGPAGLNQPTNPGPNPFTPLALQFYQHAIDANGFDSNHIAAVGGSDDHSAGDVDPTDVTAAPIGEPTTEVYAPELSEPGIEQGVLAGHTYVKLWGSNGPDARLEAQPAGPSGPIAIMGDTVDADQATITARALNLSRAAAARPGPYAMLILRNGVPYLTIPAAPGQDQLSYSFQASGPARYQVEVTRPLVGVASIETVSSPIYLEHPQSQPPPPPPGRCETRLEGSPRADTFFGTSGSDSFRGRRGDDRIHGRGGSDCLSGGRGRDVVQGGKGKDSLRGGPGRDLLRAADHGKDRVNCGRGRRDKAVVSRADVVKRCERVRRR